MKYLKYSLIAAAAIVLGLSLSAWAQVLPESVAHIVGAVPLMGDPLSLVMLANAPAAISLEVITKSLERFTTESGAILTKHSETLEEMRARMQDIEQKLAKKPGGDGGGSGAAVSKIMDCIEASDEFKALRSGKLRTASIPLPAAAMKAITSTISGGTISEPDRSGEFIAPSERRLTIRGLLPNIPTTSGSTQYVRELVYTNNAGPQYDSTSPTPGSEGALKNESDLSVELITTEVVTLAHGFTLPRQALDDTPGLRQYVETRGLYGLALEEEDQILNGAGANGDLDGLMNNATAFTGGATNQTALDTLRKAATQLLVSDNIPSGVVLNPSDLETLELAKDTTGRYLDMVIIVNGQPFVWRMPVVQTNSMSAGQFLMGDFQMAARVRDRQNPTVEISLDHKDYRQRNLAFILIEERLALEIPRTAALVKGNISHAG